MSQYTKVLVAIDLSEDSGQVVSRAKAIIDNNQAELHLIHVIEPLSFAYGGDILYLGESCRKAMTEIGRG